MMFTDLALRQRRLAGAELMFGKGLALCGEYSQNSTRKKNLLNNALAGLAAVSDSRMDWKQAVARLSNWVNADQKNANAHSRLGQAQFRLGQIGKTSASFTTARKLDVQRPLPEVSMALLYEQARERPQAETLIKQAVQIAPQNLNTRLAVVRWALSAGMHELASENLKVAQKLDAYSLDVKLSVGLAARFAGNHKQAVGALEAALQQSLRNFEAMNHLALTLIDATDEKERIRALGYAQLNAQIRSARSSRPAGEATVTLAWVLFRLGHADGAERVLQAILNSGPISSESDYYAAVMLHDRGRADISRKILQTALVRGSQFPGRPEAEHMLEHLSQSAAANTPKRGGNLRRHAVNPWLTARSIQIVTENRQLLGPFGHFRMKFEHSEHLNSCLPCICCLMINRILCC